jgi:hypothetical protein
VTPKRTNTSNTSIGREQRFQIHIMVQYIHKMKDMKRYKRYEKDTNPVN